MSEGSLFGGSQGKRAFGGGTSVFGSEGSDEVAVDLNLTPLMDVMSNILFFLLASFGAAVVSFIGVSVPVQSDAPGAEPRTDTVTVNLRILPGEYRITASNGAVDADKLAGFRTSVPRGAEGYDHAGLNHALQRIKMEFPGSDTLVIVPSETTVYAEIVEAMDAAREYVADGKPMRLLPKVVVADLVKAETTP
jgi:biopolymer transport protein ExbD